MAMLAFIIAPVATLLVIGLIFAARSLFSSSAKQQDQDGRALPSGGSPVAGNRKSGASGSALSAQGGRPSTGTGNHLRVGRGTLAGGASAGPASLGRATISGNRVKLLVHSINNDRCTGCDACVLVCPTDVLELVDNKSHVARFDDCIQCEQCAHVCPTTALVMHYEGTEPPPVMVPDLDQYYQARTVPGLYLLGEAAGKPLVKNAINLGRAAVEHAIASGLLTREAQRTPDGALAVDVIIVGSGPAGLSAALSCLQRGLSFVVLEKDAIAASTIARYPKGKKVMAEPYNVRCVGLLPVWDATKDETILEWNRVLSQVNLELHLREAVEEVQPLPGRGFLVRSDKGRYLGQRVLLCVGTRGKPRRLGVPGEDLPHVQPLLDDPDLYRGRTVLVVGGGDSAVEAAIALAEPSLRNRVLLSYRGKQFNRVKAKNRQALDEAVAQQRVLVLLGSTVRAFRPGQADLLLGDGRQKPVPAEQAFVLIGGDPPVKWLEAIGVRYVAMPHSFTLGQSDALVESLVGRQPSMDRPGLPLAPGLPVFGAPQLPDLAGLGDNEATLMQDQGVLLAALHAPPGAPPPPLSSLAGYGGKREATIMIPKDQFLLHLPEKLQLDSSHTRVGLLRSKG